MVKQSNFVVSFHTHTVDFVLLLFMISFLDFDYIYKQTPITKPQSFPFAATEICLVTSLPI